MTQERFAHLTPDVQPFVWLSQDFEQPALDPRFHHGLEQLSTLQTVGRALLLVETFVATANQGVRQALEALDHP